MKTKHLLSSVAVIAALTISAPAWAQPANPSGGNAVGLPGPNPGAAEGVGGILVGSDVALPPAGIRPDGPQTQPRRCRQSTVMRAPTMW